MKEPNCPLSRPRQEVTAEFIEKNRLTLARSPEEIRARLNAEAKGFGFDKEIYLDYLSFDDALSFLTEDARKKYGEGGEPWPRIDAVDEAAQDFLDYMNFAWGKAEDQRGISASRSIQKLGAWLWLLGRNDLVATIENDDLYNPYGAPALVAVCDDLGVEVPESLREFAKHPC